MKKIFIATTFVAALAVTSFWILNSETIDGESQKTTLAKGKPLVSISVPPLDGEADIGRKIFENNCAACHGENGVGSDGFGPPLIHPIYKPSHHPDESFQRAASAGVRSHHWRFGNMPPINGLSRSDVALVITYIRHIQRANGIN